MSSKKSMYDVVIQVGNSRDEQVSHGDLDALWGMANEMIAEIQVLKEQLQNPDYVSDNMQMKRDLEFVYQRCHAWTALMTLDDDDHHHQACRGQLSNETITYVEMFENELLESEQEELGEGDELLEAMNGDLNVIKKRIKQILDMNKKQNDLKVIKSEV